MATKTKEKRVTAASVIRDLLGAARVAPDDKLIGEVKKRSGSKTFNKAQLAWYKSRFRAGALAGMKGKRHLIKQADKAIKRARKATEEVDE